jgi:type IV pilus assembly protein PilA
LALRPRLAALNLTLKGSAQMIARIRKSIEEKDQGFTLIELLVVIIIIGILAAIAIPVFLNQRTKGWDAQAKSDLKNMATAQETYLTDNGTYTAALGDLETAGFNVSGDTSNHTPTTFADAAAGYCLAVDSKSGTTWYYDSENTIPNDTGFVSAEC